MDVVDKLLRDAKERVRHTALLFNAMFKNSIKKTDFMQRATSLLLTLAAAVCVKLAAPSIHSYR